MPSSLGGKIIILIVLFLIVAAGAVGISQSQKNSETSNQSETNEKTKDLGSGIVMYGNFQDQKTILEGFNLKNGETYTIAEIGQIIKQVTMLNNNEVLFISELNNADTGKSLSVYSLKDKSIRNIYTAPDNYLIDLYTISPNKNVIALWQVAPHPEDSTISGGNSQVMVIELENGKNTGFPTIIASEQPTEGAPISYPIAALDNGEIFLDSIIPNTGLSGWHQGMRVVNYKTSEERQITSVPNGSYAIQPILSPDQKLLAFVGYNGEEGNGTTIISGAKRAQIESNTIETLTTDTLSKKTLLSNNNLFFDNVVFSPDSSTLFYTSYHDEGKKINSVHISSGLNLEGKGNLSDPGVGILSAFSDSTVLVGTPSRDVGFISSLGKMYTPAISSFGSYTLPAEVHSEIPISDSSVQFINMEPELFASRLSQKQTGLLNLQIDTFYTRPELPKKRSSLVVNNPITPTPNEFAGEPDCADPTWFIPKKEKENNNLTRGDSQAYQRWHMSCLGTPLYVYGNVGQEITVDFKTKVFNTIPEFTNSLHITVGKNQTITIDSKTYDKVSYDIFPAKPLKKPIQGIVTESKNIQAEVKKIAENLGLNQKETTDLLKKIPHIPSAYAFLSYYSQFESKQINPLSFSPKPDTYINYVFYVEPLDTHQKTQPLKFPEIPKRNALTVVDISIVSPGW